MGMATVHRGSAEMEPKCELALKPDHLHRLVWEDRAEELDQVITQHLDATIADPKYGHIPLVDMRFRGSTALGLAAQLGRQRCVEVLLKHWADTLLASDIGYYPLQEATSLGDREIMRLLLLRRHEQMRQIWKVRQPGLCEALHSVRRCAHSVCRGARLMVIWRVGAARLFPRDGLAL